MRFEFQVFRSRCTVEHESFFRMALGDARPDEPGLLVIEPGGVGPDELVGDEGGIDGRGRGFPCEPFVRGPVEAVAVHVVGQRLAQRFAGEADVVPPVFDERHLVVGERGDAVVAPPYAVSFRGRAARTVHRHRVAVPEGRMDQFGPEQLPHDFERVDGFLQRLGRKSVHQVGVYHDARIAEVAHGQSGLFDRYALVHAFEQPVRSRFEPSRYGDAAGRSHQLAQVARITALEADVGPPDDAESAAQNLYRNLLEQLGRRRFVREVEAPAARLGHDAFHPVDEAGGRNALVAADIVERRVAEGALGPVASVGEGHLVPASVAPEPVHGVGHFQQRQVGAVGETLEVGASPFEVRNRAFAFVVPLGGIGMHERPSGENPFQRKLAVVEH